jgi:hypothetical protein
MKVNCKKCGKSIDVPFESPPNEYGYGCWKCFEKEEIFSDTKSITELLEISEKLQQERDNVLDKISEIHLNMLNNIAKGIKREYLEEKEKVVCLCGEQGIIRCDECLYALCERCYEHGKGRVIWNLTDMNICMNCRVCKNCHRSYERFSEGCILYCKCEEPVCSNCIDGNSTCSECVTVES